MDHNASQVPIASQSDLSSLLPGPRKNLTAVGWMILRMRFSALDLPQNHEKLGPFKVYYVDIFAVFNAPTSY